jgi:hypothetical protein
MQHVRFDAYTVSLESCLADGAYDAVVHVGFIARLELFKFCATGAVYWVRIADAVY